MKKRTTDKSVRDLPVVAKIIQGQVVVENKMCGIVFSFPVAVWPTENGKQLSWVERLTPWWDIGAPNWRPQSQRLRESCVRAINNLQGAVAPENRQRPLPDGSDSNAEREIMGGPLLQVIK